VNTAIAFHERLGGRDLRVRNATLAAEATALLARRLKTDVGASGAFAGAMGVVRLPISATPERARAICERLVDARTDAPVQKLEGALWLRLSAAAYNERADYERLADIVAVALHE
jgi:isopenicillin-N epimerase